MSYELHGDHLSLLEAKTKDELLARVVRFAGNLGF